MCEKNPEKVPKPLRDVAIGYLFEDIEHIEWEAASAERVRRTAHLCKSQTQCTHCFGSILMSIDSDNFTSFGAPSTAPCVAPMVAADTYWDDRRGRKQINKHQILLSLWLSAVFWDVWAWGNHVGSRKTAERMSSLFIFSLSLALDRIHCLPFISFFFSSSILSSSWAAHKVPNSLHTQVQKRTVHFAFTCIVGPVLSFRWPLDTWTEWNAARHSV